MTCITGQIPPMSASAINSAASDFMRRRRRMTSASASAAAIARVASVRISSKRRAGSAWSSETSRSGSARASSQRYREPSARLMTSPSSMGWAASSWVSDFPAAVSAIWASHSHTRARASLAAARCCEALMRCASAPVWSLVHSTVPDAGGSIGIPVQSQFVRLCASRHPVRRDLNALGECRAGLWGRVSTLAFVARI